MSQSHPEPLGEGLAINILTPLMQYADTLADTYEGGAQARLLWVLINDAKRRMEETFGVVNTQAPGISVEVSHVQ